MSGDSFLFLGHGEGPGALDLWVALADPRGDVTAVKQAFEAWAPAMKVAVEGAVVSVHGKRAPSGLGKHLDALLARAHAATKLGLVVRTNKVKPSARQAEALARPDAVLDVLERHVWACDPKAYRALQVPRDEESQASMHSLAWQALARLSVRAGFVQAALRNVFRGLKRQRGPAAVWHDLVAARLPTWLGCDFGCDLALQEHLATVLELSPGSVEMPERFSEAFAEQAREGQRQVDWAPRSNAFDWKDAGAVRTLLRARGAKWTRAAVDFRDSDPAHARALLGLTHAERVKLARRGDFSTKMLNAATLTMTAGKFEDALRLFEAGIEGPFHPGAAANPLYAVQDDNNHLGIDQKRHRRFLERCLPHGPKNPTVFLNASFVAMELGDHEQCLAMLQQAKEHGVNVKHSRNERLFSPLRQLPAFKALMR